MILGHFMQALVASTWPSQSTSHVRHGSGWWPSSRAFAVRCRVLAYGYTLSDLNHASLYRPPCGAAEPVGAGGFRAAGCH